MPVSSEIATEEPAAIAVPSGPRSSSHPTGLSERNPVMPLTESIAGSLVLAASARPGRWRPTTFFRYDHRGRSLSLDLLRGIAILLVIGRHFIIAPVGLGVIEPFAAAWTGIGWAGVDLFFVLSGYLVSGLLFAEYGRAGHVDVPRFIIRRGFKIWPSYLVYLGFVALWLATINHDNTAVTFRALWPNLLHVQNYFHTPRIHTWSLAVEEHFYLVVALLCWAVLRRRRTRTPFAIVPAAIGTLIFGIALARYATYQAEGPDLNLYATHLRFDGLLIGTLLAYWTHFRPQVLAPIARHPLACLVAGAILASPVLVLDPEFNRWTASIGLTALYAGFGLILVGWLNLETKYPRWRKILTMRPAAILGQIGFYSYSIYLWHIDLAQTPLKKALAAIGPTALPASLVWICVTIFYVFLALLVGRMLAQLIELPSLALRDRLFPKKDGARAQSLSPTVALSGAARRDGSEIAAAK